jgi:hypothetical protein
VGAGERARKYGIEVGRNRFAFSDRDQVDVLA